MKMKRTYLPHPNSDEMASTGGVASTEPMTEVLDPASDTASGASQDTDPATTVAAQGDGDDGGGTKTA